MFRAAVISILLLTGGCATTPRVPVDDTSHLSELTAAFRAEAMATRQQAVARTKTLRPAASIQCVDAEEGIDLSGMPPVDISFIEADIREALLELSMLTEIPIVADDTVQGLVTATLLGKSLESALEVILAPGNFAYKRHQDFIYVGSQYRGSPSLAVLSETCRFRPHNVEASKLANLLSPAQREFINVNEENNLISIFAPPAMQKRIQESLKLLDKPREQVLLEVSIVEVSREVFDILGIHWGNLNLIEEGLELAMVNELLNRNGTGQTNYNVAGASNVNTVAMKRFKDSIGILKSHGEVDIKAMPSITTLDGKPANFNSTETMWLAGISNNTDRSKGLAYGVNINIVPHIGADHGIRLDIVDASVSDLTMAAGGEPLLISHSVSNFVEVTNGDVVVLGGLLQKKQRESEAGMPGLSKVPAVKRLFSQKRTEMKETEVLIVIKPTILG